MKNVIEISPKERCIFLREMLRAQKKNQVDLEVGMRILKRQMLAGKENNRIIIQQQAIKAQLTGLEIAMAVTRDEFLETYEKLTEEEREDFDKLG